MLSTFGVLLIFVRGLAVKSTHDSCFSTLLLGGPGPLIFLGAPARQGRGPAASVILSLACPRLLNPRSVHAYTGLDNSC